MTVVFIIFIAWENNLEIHFSVYAKIKILALIGQEE